MSFQSLDQILQALSNQLVDPKQEPLDQIITVWPDVVGEKTARFSRPVRLSNGILQVATANAVWAQQLTFARRSWLTRLNRDLDEPLRDIRLSPGLWHRDIDPPQPNPEYQLSEHPSYWGAPGPSLSSWEPVTPNSLPSSPQRAFEALLQKVAVHTHQLPLCPVCHCPTPIGELERWSVCAVCAVSDPELERE
ncbi:MAG: putative RNA-binding protein [Phormidium sp. OSCR]|nr:MAG: putative RNA-binding protein [Phormidium sp. OSCR]